MHHLWILLSLLLCSASLDSLAGEDIKCNVVGTQQEMEACARDDFNEADKELNQIYQALLGKEADDPLFVSKLRDAQRAWLAFLNADLDAQFACAEDESRLACWGSQYGMAYLTRKAELTRERTKHLQRFLEEGHGE
jgi:uncharacterized protein YecT (DUF1311 family)